MSDRATTNDVKKYKWVVNLAGAYLGLCIGMHLIYSPDEQYNDIIKHCGDSSAFCACQAQAIVDQRSFLTQPLLLVGLKTLKKVGPMCAGHRG